MPFLRRRNYLIDKHFQLKHLLITLILVALFVLILLTTIFLPYVFELFSDVPLSEKAKAADVALVLHQNIWPGVGVAAVFIAVASIFITHKVAGPVYALKRVMREIAGGNMRVRAKLRKGDDLKDMETALNEMTESLETTLIFMDRELKIISSNMAEMERKLGLPDIPGSELLEVAEKVKNEIKVMEVSLGKLKFGDKTVR